MNQLVLCTFFEPVFTKISRGFIYKRREIRVSTATSTILGLIFLGLGNASVFLMYKLWGYPFDRETRTSAAPKSLVFVHRAIGYAYLIPVHLMMWHMVPRLWKYQVELPPRTVAHLMLGITIGVLLLVKISILRFFRHFEEAMPYIGTALLICTYLLISLSIPFTLRKVPCESRGMSSVMPASNERIRDCKWRDCRLMHHLISWLRGGIARGSEGAVEEVCSVPRFTHYPSASTHPPDWMRTVARMAIKPMIGEPITLEDQ